MRNLDVVLTPAKNALDSEDPWLVLLEITHNGETLRYARNNEDVTYESVVWSKFNFAIQTLVDTTNEVPSMALAISNADRVVESYVGEAGGYIGANVRILIIYAGSLSSDPAIDENFSVKSTVITDETVVFTLGIQNPLVDPFPSNNYNRRICRFKLGDDDCTYSGSETECDKTMVRCLELENEAHFGGFPAIPGGFFDF